MKQKSAVIGTQRLSKKLKRIIQEADVGMAEAMKEVLVKVGETAYNTAPVDTGDMRDSITVKLSGDGLSGVVGPAAEAAALKQQRTGRSIFATRFLGGRRISAKGTVTELTTDKEDLVMQYFKAYWAEFGTKGNAERAKRSGKKGGKKLRVVPPQPARPFMQPAWDANARWARNKIREKQNEAIRKVAKSDV